MSQIAGSYVMEGTYEQVISGPSSLGPLRLLFCDQVVRWFFFDEHKQNDSYSVDGDRCTRFAGDCRGPNRMGI